MKSTLLLALSVCLTGAVEAKPRELAVPRKWGLYVADVSNGRVRFVGDCRDWALSPNKRFIVAGRESAQGNTYEVRLLSTSTWSAKRLERFNIKAAGGASFRWSGDSSRVSVTSSRLREEQQESRTFLVGRPSRQVRFKTRALSGAVLRKLKARFSDVNEVAFSPGGKRVVGYLSGKSSGGLWEFRPDGSGLRRLTRNAYSGGGDFHDREAVWLDDRRIAFRRTSFEDEGI